MAVTAGTWDHQFCGFVGPARLILDRGETNEFIFPASQGNAVVDVREDTHEVVIDETGNTPKEVFSIGQRLEVTYPMLIAHLEGLAKAITGDNYLLTDTVDPDGTGSTSPLVARKKAQNYFQYPHKKTEYTADIYRVADPPFDNTGEPVARSTDRERFGLYIPHAVILAPDGNAFEFGNKDTVYTMRILAVNPIGSTDPYYVFFNTDLEDAA